MKTILVVLFLLSHTTAAARTATSVASHRGFFSLGLLAGSDERRALTTDGQYSAYSGLRLGGSFDFRVVGEGQGELRLFANHMINDLKSKENETDKLGETTTLWGLKAFFTEMFYLGAGYGSTVQKFSAGSLEPSTTNPIIGMGLGIEYPVGETLFLGAHAWYQNNPIRAGGELTGNSFAEGGSVYLSLIWSPPVTVITTTIVGGR